MRRAAALGGSAAVAVAVVAAYLGYIARCTTNGVYWDDWSLVDLLRRSYAGNLTLSDLWLQHNQNRTFFPNVIVLFFGLATRFSEIDFIYLGAAFLIAAAPSFAFFETHAAFPPQDGSIRSNPS